MQRGKEKAWSLQIPELGLSLCNFFFQAVIGRLFSKTGQG